MVACKARQTLSGTFRQDPKEIPTLELGHFPNVTDK